MHDERRPLLDAALREARKVHQDRHVSRDGAHDLAIGRTIGRQEKARRLDIGPVAVIPAPDTLENLLANRRAHMVEAAEIDHAAPSLRRSTTVTVITEDGAFEIGIAPLIARAIDVDIAGSLGQGTAVDAVFERQLAHKSLSGTVLTDQQCWKPMWRVADRAFEMVDARPIAQLEPDRLVEIVGLVHSDSLEQLLHRGELELIELAPKKALRRMAMEKDYGARVHLDGQPLPHQLIKILTGKTTAHMAFGGDVRRRKGTDVVRIEIPRKPVKPLEHFRLGVV